MKSGRERGRTREGEGGGAEGMCIDRSGNLGYRWFESFEAWLLLPVWILSKPFLAFSYSFHFPAHSTTNPFNNHPIGTISQSIPFPFPTPLKTLPNHSLTFNIPSNPTQPSTAANSHSTRSSPAHPAAPACSNCRHLRPWRARSRTARIPGSPPCTGRSRPPCRRRSAPRRGPLL